MKKIARRPQREVTLMLDEYDFSKGVRGKYHRRYSQGSNVIVLDPDVAKIFTSKEMINRALRSLVEIIKLQKRAA